MDWVKGLQKSINYIEDNILKEINYNNLAKCTYSSSFHFQRTFSLITGITVGEYIRNRRLTLAGIELSMSSAKVIDVALKYGYETPESFSKAFTRFHGITPSTARTAGAKLKSFSRLSIKITLEGGDIMNYSIVQKEAFKVIAKTKNFSSDTLISAKEIPQFWTDCFENGTASTLLSYAKKESKSNIVGTVNVGTTTLGICDAKNAPYDNEHFNYSIGVETSAETVPNGYNLITVPASTWAVFKCVGAMPNAIQDMWKRVYTEFLPQSEYELIESIDLEVYYEGDNSSPEYVSEIWIPVIRKND